VVEFPFPSEESREQIWRTHFPADAPVEKDIDFPLLARQFKLTGADIKNVVLHGAFAAAETNAKIGMAHLIEGVKSEFLKKGKLVVKSDFGAWFENAPLKTPA
jgi:ATP-dependent 26S proteasome regulatory subunit